MSHHDGKVCHAALSRDFDADAALALTLPALLTSLLAEPCAADPLNKELASLYYADLAHNERAERAAASRRRGGTGGGSAVAAATAKLVRYEQAVRSYVAAYASRPAAELVAGITSQGMEGPARGGGRAGGAAGGHAKALPAPRTSGARGGRG